MTKEALKLAQEPSATRPCRSCGGTGERWTGINEAPTSICKPCNGTGQIALAKPAQEPVGYVYSEAGVKHGAIERDLPNGTPLYAAPPQREWVGLTEEDSAVVREEESCSFIAGAKWAEEILKGKNT